MLEQWKTEPPRDEAESARRDWVQQFVEKMLAKEEHQVQATSAAYAKAVEIAALLGIDAEHVEEHESGLATFRIGKYVMSVAKQTK